MVTEETFIEAFHVPVIWNSNTSKVEFFKLTDIDTFCNNYQVDKSKITKIVTNGGIGKVGHWRIKVLL